MIFRYLTHPQVVIDPAVPVPDWSLSDTGKARAARFAGASVLAATRRIVASAETKAVETAAIVGAALGLMPEIRPAMHENDRSATGYLAGAAFDTACAAFFGVPEENYRGWERAVDAQRRVVAETEAVLSAHGGGDLLLVGHGGVGTLLYCHYAGLAIARRHDQPAGGGNVFAIDIATRAVVHPWRAMEAF